MAGPLDSCAISHAWERYHSVNFGAKRPLIITTDSKTNGYEPRSLNESE